MERFSIDIKDSHPQLYYEHIHRYLLAKEIIKGGTVLDIACGSGYGSNMLAEVANKVIGIDVSQEAISLAESLYAKPNLEFKTAPCENTQIREASVDFITSFETIEHIDNPVLLLDEIGRLLKAKGVLVISSPNKLEYTDKPGTKNEYHKKELYHEDFTQLLSDRYKYCVFGMQRLVAGSLIIPDQQSKKAIDSIGTYYGDERGSSFSPNITNGLYSIAICSNAPLANLKFGIFENQRDSAIIWDCREKVYEVKAEMAKLANEKSSIDDLIKEKDKNLRNITISLDTARKSLAELASQNKQGPTPEDFSRVEKLLNIIAQKLESNDDFTIKVAKLQKTAVVGLERSLANLNRNLGEKVDAGKKLTEHSWNSHQKSLREVGEDLSQIIHGIAEKVDAGQALSTELKDSQEQTIRELGESVSKLIHGIAEKVDAGQALSTELKDSQEQTIREFGESVSKLIHGIAEKVDAGQALSTELKDSQEQTIREFGESVSKLIHGIAEKVDAGQALSTELKDSQEQTIRELGESVSKLIYGIAEKVDAGQARSLDFRKSISSVLATIEKQICIAQKTAERVNTKQENYLQSLRRSLTTRLVAQQKSATGQQEALIAGLNRLAKRTDYLKEELDQKTSDIDEFKKDKEAAAKEISKLESTVSRKSDQIENLYESINDIEDQNAAAQDVVNNQKRRIASLEIEAGEKSIELEGIQRDLEVTRSELLDRRRTLTETQAQLAETRTERDNFNDRYERIKTTFSWKSTMPLRAVRRFFYK